MKILTAFACVLSINVASAELVVYEGTAIVTAITDHGLQEVPAPFTAQIGDDFRFRAIIDTSIPGRSPGGTIYDDAVLDLDLWLRGEPLVLPAHPPLTDEHHQDLHHQVTVGNDYAFPEGEPAYDYWGFGWYYRGTDGNRYSFGFGMTASNTVMLSSDAIPVAIDNALADTLRTSLQVIDVRGDIYSPAFDTTSFTISTAADLLQRLHTDSEGVGPGKSLANKVTLAQTYYAVPDLVSTCAVLGEYVQHTAHKKVPAAQGAALAEDARLITSAIGCE